MSRFVVEDHYAVLGVGRNVGPDELRRVYRQLALRYHPDVAGEAAKEAFQKIAAAYEVLSDAHARAVFDARLREYEGASRGAHGVGHDAAGPTYSEKRRPRPAPNVGPILERLSGKLDDLLARGVAHRSPDGTIELFITVKEAESGGTAAIDALLQVPCQNCGGMAERRHLWCAKCQYDGSVLDEVTVCVPIPPLCPDGTMFSFQVDPTGKSPPLRVRIRL